GLTGTLATLSARGTHPRRLGQSPSVDGATHAQWGRCDGGILTRIGVRAATLLVVFASLARAGLAIAASGDEPRATFEHGGMVSGEQVEPRRWFAASTI